ncbi:MAG TPA: hypothetical protein VGE59_01245 [Patescibacteria group bacterium]
MTKNPIINAFAALVYIALVASAMYYGSSYAGGEDNVFAPIAMLSLFTLSAAVMGYLFLVGPALLYLEGKKKEGITFFLHTLGAFAVITAAAFLLFVLM